MSRTDTHAPWWVLERDPYLRRHFRVNHWHDVQTDWDPVQRRWLRSYLAPCDLHERDTRHEPPRTRCHYSPVGSCRFCSCRMCGMQAQRKRQYRQVRTWWKVTRANLLQAANAGDDDALDVTPFHGRAW